MRAKSPFARPTVAPWFCAGLSSRKALDCWRSDRSQIRYHFLVFPIAFRSRFACSVAVRRRPQTTTTTTTTRTRTTTTTTTTTRARTRTTTTTTTLWR
eukprot:2604984-Pyramimonas_sp.AAC.1